MGEENNYWIIELYNDETLRGMADGTMQREVRRRHDRDSRGPRLRTRSVVKIKIYFDVLGIIGEAE